MADSLARHLRTFRHIRFLEQPDRRKRAHLFDAIIVAFGILWAADAIIQAFSWFLTPHGGAHLVSAFTGARHHAPTWLRPLYGAILGLVHAVGPSGVALFMVALAAALSASLIDRRAYARMAVLGLIWSLACWVALDALGFPYAGGQTDPGVFIPYAISFLFVLSAYGQYDDAEDWVKRHSDTLWRIARISFALLWAFDAALKWLPAFLFHFSAQITGVIPGQPIWVADWLHLIAALVALIGPTLFGVIVALVETVIALGLLTQRFLWAIVPIGIVYSVSVWATAEAFGGPYTAAGTGVRGNVIGNVIVYLIPFLFVGADLVSRLRLGAAPETQGPAGRGDVR